METVTEINSSVFKSIKKLEARETSEWFKILAVFVENLGLVPLH